MSFELRKYLTRHVVQHAVQARRLASAGMPRRQVWRGSQRFDRGLETIVAKALEIEADHRYGRAGVLARDFLRRTPNQLPYVLRLAMTATIGVRRTGRLCSLSTKS